MAIETPIIEPDSVIAGVTVKWTKDLADFLPADSWVLKYTLINAGDDGKRIDITATDNGDGRHLVNVAKATTADWRHGLYHWNNIIIELV